jgi:hypothetical protein
MTNQYRITGVPSYLEKVAGELKEQGKLNAEAIKDDEQQIMIRSGKVNRYWAADHMNMINHGFGVMEDRRTGSVWHVDGEFLVRQDSDEDIEAIISTL